jgi:hypothetical protein
MLISCQGSRFPRKNGRTLQLRRLRVFVTFDIHSKFQRKIARGFLSGQLPGDTLVLYEPFMP